MSSSPQLQRIRARRGVAGRSETNGQSVIIGPPGTSVGVGGSFDLALGGGSRAGATATGQVALSTLLILIFGLVVTDIYFFGADGDADLVADPH